MRRSESRSALPVPDDAAAVLPADLAAAGAPFEEAARPEDPGRRHAPRPVPVTVWRRVDCTVEEAFALVVPIDLPSVFRGYGPLPAVASATPSSDGRTWGHVGQTRTVALADHSRVHERVTEVTEPGLFAYEVVPASGLLRLLVVQIEGRFLFARSEGGGTVIRWTYVFRVRRGRRPLLRLLAPIWRRYAVQVMREIGRAAAVRSAAPSTD